MPGCLRLWLGVLTVLCSAALWLCGSMTAGDDKPGPTGQPKQERSVAKKAALSVFMRQKLAASQQVLEGLAIEDFDLILQGAKQLKATGAADEFMVHNDVLYKEFATDFSRIIQRLEKLAKEEKLDAAALVYVDMTLNCVECHKHVRNILVADR